jgi:hypothetical protein
MGCMEYYNGIMCVTYRELASSENGEPVIKRCTLNQNIVRGNIQCLKRGGGEGSCALIVYNSLPEKYRKRYEKKNGGTPEEIHKRKAMKDKAIINIDPDAEKFFTEVFKYDLNGIQTTLDVTLAREYTVNASVLKMLLRRKKELYSSMLENQIRTGNGVENIAEGMNAALGHLRKIEENTGSSDEHLEKIEKSMETMKDDIAVIKRDGLKTR